MFLFFLKQLTKYQHHHSSGDVKEEHTFIVDLSSRTQRAQRRHHGMQTHRGGLLGR